MKKTLPLTAVAALLALAACNSKPAAPEVVDSNPDPMANQLANAAPVELPPSIKSEQTMRCKDNSLAYVTFFQGGKQAGFVSRKAVRPRRSRRLPRVSHWSPTAAGR